MFRLYSSKRPQPLNSVDRRNMFVTQQGHHDEHHRAVEFHHSKISNVLDSEILFIQQMRTST